MKDTGEKKVWRKPQKPPLLYAQELLIKSKVHDIRVKKGYCADPVNGETALASQFGSEILYLYARAAERSIPCPTPEGERWKYLREEFGKEFATSEEIAQALCVPKQRISDSKLLHEERRAGIRTVCCTAIGLGAWKESYQMLEKRFACTLEAAWEEEHEEEAAGRNNSKGEKNMKFPELEAEKEEKIRQIGQKFGYHLPTKEDDEERIRIFRDLIEEMKPEVSIGSDEDEQNKKETDEKLGKFLNLSTDRVDTLKRLLPKWSQNANKLHVIIAAGRKGCGVERIRTLYHALGLHPVGWEDVQGLKTRDEFSKALVISADQVVYASIQYFRPLMEKLHMPLGEDEQDKPGIFWCLLYGLLEYHDTHIYKDTKIGLLDQLFFMPSEEFVEKMKSDLTAYIENAQEGTAFKLVDRKTLDLWKGEKHET